MVGGCGGGGLLTRSDQEGKREERPETPFRAASSPPPVDTSCRSITSQRHPQLGTNFQRMGL